MACFYLCKWDYGKNYREGVLSPSLPLAQKPLPHDDARIGREVHSVAFLHVVGLIELIEHLRRAVDVDVCGRVFVGAQYALLLEFGRAQASTHLRADSEEGLVIEVPLLSCICEPGLLAADLGEAIIHANLADHVLAGIGDDAVIVVLRLLHAPHEFFEIVWLQQRPFHNVSVFIHADVNGIERVPSLVENAIANRAAHQLAKRNLARFVAGHIRLDAAGRDMEAVSTAVVVRSSADERRIVPDALVDRLVRERSVALDVKKPNGAASLVVAQALQIEPGVVLPNLRVDCVDGDGVELLAKILLRGIAEPFARVDDLLVRLDSVLA